MFCSQCGNEITNSHAVICTKCGCAISQTQPVTGIKQGWNVGLMIVFCLLSFFCPLVGWILGGDNLNKEKNSGGRRKQSIALIVVASIGFVIWTACGILLIEAAMNSLSPLHAAILRFLGCDPW